MLPRVVGVVVILSLVPPPASVERLAELEVTTR